LNQDYLGSVVSALSARGIEFDAALTDKEVEGIEASYGLRFPPDLRRLLQHALPISKGFPNWRLGEPESLRKMLRWPVEGICFDIEHNAFWHEVWGPKPSEIPRALDVASRAVAAAPALVPVYLHRYIPAEPEEVGNPVFSVYQTDIVYYGHDLPSYLENEFRVQNPYPVPAQPRPIRFWAELVD
jgi:hypothetical protein